MNVEEAEKKALEWLKGKYDVDWSQARSVQAKGMVYIVQDDFKLKTSTARQRFEVSVKEDGSILSFGKLPCDPRKCITSIAIGPYLCPLLPESGAELDRSTFEPKCGPPVPFQPFFERSAFDGRDLRISPQPLLYFLLGVLVLYASFKLSRLLVRELYNRVV